MLKKSQRLIKKYPNRRLYDTQIRAYITLEDIKQLVLDRVEFKVIDSRSQKDLTQNTLLQIIADCEMSASPLFTQAILQDFIRFYDVKSHRIFKQYLEQAMQVFNQQQKVWQKNWSADYVQEFLSLQQQLWDQVKQAVTPSKKPG